MSEDRDLYGAFYADRLWTLLPEVYRASDSDDPDRAGPLRELVLRLGDQIAMVRRSIDRTLDDQSIESCDDWLIPYVGDLVSTNLVDGLGSRQQRLDVAKTIYYRRRKGTVGLLEEVAADITGWNARVVEFFRRLGRTRHGFDPPLGLEAKRAVVQGLRGASSGTAIGGFADLRHAGAAAKAHTAFDEFHHTADLRAGRASTGWYNIPKVGIFVWRLKSFALRPTTPVEHAVCPGQFTFDPTGREIPLFTDDFRDAAQYGDAWVTPDEWMLPARIGAELLERETARLYPASVAVVNISPAGSTVLPFAETGIHPERGRFQPASPPAPGVLRAVTYCQGFSAAIGAGPYDRRAFSLAALPAPLPVSTPVSGGGTQLRTATDAIGAIGTVPVRDSLTYTAISNPWPVRDASIRADANERPVLRLPPAPWIVEGDGRSVLALEGLLVSGADIVLRGGFERVTLSCATIDPGQEIDPDGTMPTAVDGRPLRPSTIWIEGAVKELMLRRSITGPIRVRGDGVITRIVATDSIVQGVRTALPGALDPSAILDARSFVRRLRNGADPLTEFLRNSLSPALAAALAAEDPAAEPPAGLVNDLVGELNAVTAVMALYTPVRFAAVALSPALRQEAEAGPNGAALIRVNRLLLEAAFARELQFAAIIAPSGAVSLTRTTIVGGVHAHTVSASETILRGIASAEDRQVACVRFSAYEEGSRLHQPYESVALRQAAPIFVSERFGQPEYAQLGSACDREIVSGRPEASIATGAKNGSEMGAFALERNAVKERGLRVKLAEFMPIGLTPVIIKVT